MNFHPFVDQPGHFCCNGGACIVSDKVCDGIKDCYSGEDEIDCSKVIREDDYDTENPVDSLFVNITIIDVKDLHESHSSFEIFFRDLFSDILNYEFNFLIFIV